MKTAERLAVFFVWPDRSAGRACSERIGIDELFERWPSVEDEVPASWPAIATGGCDVGTLDMTEERRENETGCVFPPNKYLSLLFFSDRDWSATRAGPQKRLGTRRCESSRWSGTLGVLPARFQEPHYDECADI